MMRYLHISIVLPIFFVLFFQSNGQGQKLEVGLKSGKVVYPKSLRLEEYKYNGVVLIVDDQQIRTDSVKYYKNENGYYRWYKVEAADDGFRVKRTEKGNVNAYTQVDQLYSKDGEITGEFFNSYPDFIEKEEGELWQVNYENLYKALSDNEQSAKKLEQAKNLNIISRFGLGLAGGLAIAGLLDTFDVADNDEDTKISPYLLAGVGVAVVSVVVRMPYNKKLKESISAYNR